MLERHVAILRELQELSKELVELSARDVSTLSDAEAEALTSKIVAIRSEIARLREMFRETLN